MKKHYIPSCLIFLLAGILSSSESLLGSSFSWNTTSGIWGTSSNWTPSGVPTSEDVVSFTANTLSSSVTITVDDGSGGGVYAGIINVGDLGSTYAYTLSGNSITMNNGASNSQINQASSTAGDTIASALYIGGNGNLDITNYSTKYLTISGAIYGTASTGNVNVVTVKNNSTGAVNLYGISDGANGGTVTLILEGGDGTIYMRQSNNSTFGGAVEIKSGTVVLSSGAGLGSSTTNSVTIDSGASLQMNGKTGINRNFVLYGMGKTGKGAIVNSTGTASISSTATITLSGDSGFGPAAGAGITVNGTIVGTGCLWLLDSGTLTLNHSNTYSGGTQIGTGTLVAGASGALGSGNVTVSSGATLTLSVLNTVADYATLVFEEGSIINLSYSGTETVGALNFNGDYISSGTYSASELNSYFSLSSDVFYGSGLLMVAAIPEMKTLDLILCGVLLYGVFCAQRVFLKMRTSFL